MHRTAAIFCPRCGSSVPASFVGQICARCALASALPAPAGGELRVGASFGDYELIDVLGRGGMAAVYLARQVSLDRLVALKTISLLADDPARAGERFRREAHALARLDHPGIVAVHDVGATPRALFYTMDYIEGTDLARGLREGPFTPRQCAVLLQTVAGAMDYAHQQGVIHRDLKPANILLDCHGEPHVVDFGLAIEIEEANRLTRNSDLAGMPLYMAPERLAGRRHGGEAAGDIYALGAILFEMLTGRLPFVGHSPPELLDRILRAKPPSPRLLNPAVAPDLETICLKCLEKSPASRYPSMGALGADLGRWVAGEPIVAQRASEPARVWCLVRKLFSSR